MTESNVRTAFKPGAYSLITALAMIALMTVLYTRGVTTFLGYPGYLGYALMLTMAILACQARKRANQGLLSFQEALKTAFLMIVVGLAAQTLFDYIVMNFMDVKFKAAATGIALKRTENLMRSSGYSDEKIAEAMADQRSKDPYALSSQIFGLALFSIIGFIFALIIAAITGKTNQAYKTSALNKK